MTAFPTPPPLKPKPEAPRLPESALSKITNPSLATQLVIAAGLVTAGVVFLIGMGVYFVLHPLLQKWNIPSSVPYVVIAVCAAFGFSIGSRAVQHAVVDALKSDE